MADAAPGGNAAAPGNVPQPVVPPVVPPPGADDQGPPFTAAQNALIPPELTLSNPLRRHNDYKAFYKALYLTLAVVEANVDGVVTSVVISTYLSMNQADFAAWKTTHPIMGTYTQVPPDLYRILQVLLQPPQGQQNSQLQNLLTDLALNNVLVGSQFGNGLDADEENLEHLVFKRWIQAGVISLLHQHEKGRMMVALYQRHVLIKEKLTELKNTYQRLLASLSNRKDTNDLALYVTRHHQKILEETKAYLEFTDNDIIRNIRMYIPDHSCLDDFSIVNPQGLEAIVEASEVWTFHHTSTTVNPLHLAPFNETANTLQPILDGIRSFQQSPKEAAIEQANNLKPDIVQLMTDVGKFLDGNRTLGGAKTFRASLTSIKGYLDGFRPHGITINVDTVGTSNSIMLQYSTELENFITDKESENRKAENQARVEASELSKSAPTLKLPELHNFDSWLSWKSSHDAILPLHRSELIKKQILRNSLRNQDDLMRTKDLEYQQALEYLERRYNSPFLIPKLIESLVNMKKASDNYSSYKNLTAFVALYSQLKSQKAEGKLDSAVRDRLLPVVLHGANLSLFYRDSAKHEKQMKDQEAASSPDHISILSQAQGEEYEEKRREFFVQELMTYLDVTRRIVSATGSAGEERPKHKNHKNFSTHPTSGHLCPVCNEAHTSKNGEPLQSLSRCTRFLGMDVKTRLSNVRKFNYCTRCLRSKSDPAHLNPDGKGCRISNDKGWHCTKCVPPSKTHHPLLHDGDLSAANASRSHGRGGQGGQGGGRGGPKRGRGRGAGHRAYHTGHGDHQAHHGQGAGGGDAPNDDCPVPDEDNDNCPFPDGDDDNINVTGSNILPCYKTFHQSNFGLDKRRFFITCCQEIQLKSNGKIFNAICLLDIGSSMGYCTTELAERCGLKQSGSWEGEVSTLHGSKPGIYPIFVVDLLDKDGNIISVKFLGAPRIGQKQALPNKLFKRLCHDFKLSPGSVQNIGGEISLLLGLDQCSLLADKNTEYVNQNYPELYVCSSALSYSYIFCGSLGRELLHADEVSTVCFKADLLCFATQHVTAKQNEDSVFAVYNGNDENDFILRTYLSPKLRKINALRLASQTCFYSMDQTTSAEHPCVAPNGIESTKTLVHVDFQPKSLNWAEEDQLNDVDNYISSSVVYQAKPSPLGNIIDEAIPVPSLTCQSCAKMLAGCRDCKYLSSELSIMDLKQLQIMRDCIKVIPDPEGSGKKRIHVDYPFTVNVDEAFHCKFSNVHIAKRNTERLRERLMKLGLHKTFHEEMVKAVDQGHTGLVEDYSLELSPQHFVLINFVLKDSLSQACRPVSNSGANNTRGFNLNDSTLAGPSCIASGLSCLLAFRFRSFGWCSDLSRAYRSCLTSSIVNQLRMFWWYKNVEKPETLSVFNFRRMNYGDRPSAILLELALREHLSPVALTKEVKEATQRSRLVDDFTSSTDHLSRLPIVEEDITQMCEEFGFKVKHFLYTGQTQEDGSDLVSQILGLKCNFTQDQLMAQTSFHAGVKRRGAQVGPPLSDVDISTLKITRTTLSRIGGQCFSYDGVLLAPVQSTLRILFSRACASLKNDWTTEIKSVDKELDLEIRAVFENIKNLAEDIKPLPRSLIPAGCALRRICVSSDAAKFCLGILIYFLSQDTKTGEWHSRLTYAKPKIHTLSIPAGELSAMFYGIKSIPELLSLSQDLTEEIRERSITFYIISDSMCSLASLNPLKTHRDVRTRNSIISIHRICEELTVVHPNITINFLHQCSENVPADLVSRQSPDPVAVCNSAFYREGCELWKNNNWPLEESICLKFSNNKPVFFKQPLAEQNMEDKQVDSNEHENTVQHELMDRDEHETTVQHQDGVSHFRVQTRSGAAQIMAQCDAEVPGGHHDGHPEGHDHEVPEDHHAGHDHDVPELLSADLDAGAPGDHAEDQDLVHDTETPGGCSDNVCDAAPEVRSQAESLIEPEEDVTQGWRNPGYLDKPEYLQLLENCRSLAKVLNTIKIILCLLRKGLRSSLNDAFLVLMFSHQRYYTVRHAKSLFARSDEYNILRIQTRLTDADGVKLNLNVAPILVSHEDHLLTTLLIRNAHLVHTTAPFYGHLGTLHTMARLRSGSMAVHITRVQAEIKQYLKGCSVCQMCHGKPENVNLGSPRFVRHLKETRIIWSLISADQLGPYRRSPYKGARTFTKYWVLVLSDIVTGAVNCELLESNNNYSILMALFLHSQKYQIPDFFICDRGSSINPRPGSANYKRFFGDHNMEILQIEASHQFLCSAEARIKQVKKVLKTSLHQRESLKIPNLSFSEIKSVLSALCNCFNSIQISSPLISECFLTPNHFLKGGWYLESDPKNILQSPSAKLFNANLGVLHKKMGQAQEMFTKILRENLLACSAKYLRKYPGDNPFEVGDIVISLKANGFFLGEVLSIWPQFCGVLSTEFRPPAHKNIHVKLLILIHRPDRSRLATGPGRPGLVAESDSDESGHSPLPQQSAVRSDPDNEHNSATCNHSQINPMKIIWNKFPLVTPPTDIGNFTSHGSKLLCLPQVKYKISAQQKQELRTPPHSIPMQSKSVRKSSQNFAILFRLALIPVTNAWQFNEYKAHNICSKMETDYEENNFCTNEKNFSRQLHLISSPAGKADPILLPDCQFARSVRLNASLKVGCCLNYLRITAQVKTFDAGQYPADIIRNLEQTQPAFKWHKPAPLQQIIISAIGIFHNFLFNLQNMFFYFVTFDEPHSLIKTSQLENNDRKICIFANVTPWPFWPVSTGSTALYDGQPVTLCHSLPSPELGRMTDQDPEASPAGSPLATVTDQDTASITQQRSSEATQAPGPSPDLVSSAQRQPSVPSSPCPPHFVCVEVPGCYEILATATARPRSPLSDSLIGAHLASVSGLAMRNRAYSEYAQHPRVEVPRVEKYSLNLPKRSLKEIPTVGPPWIGTAHLERPRTIGGNTQGHIPVSGSTTSAVTTPVWPPRPMINPPPVSTFSPPPLDVRPKRLHGLNKPPPDVRLIINTEKLHKLKHKKNARKADQGAVLPWQSNSSQIQTALRNNTWIRELPQGMASTLLQAEIHGWGPKLTLDSLILSCGNKTWRPPPPFSFASEIKKPKTKKHPSVILFNPADQVQEMDVEEMDKIKHKALVLWNCICSPGVALELEEAAFVTLLQYALLSIKNWRDMLTNRPSHITKAESNNDKDAALVTGILLDTHPWFLRARNLFQELHDGNNVSTVIFQDMAFQAHYFLAANWNEAIAAEHIRLTKLGL